MSTIEAPVAVELSRIPARMPPDPWSKRQRRLRRARYKRARTAVSRRCDYCGRTVGKNGRLTVDHVVPLARGGADDARNWRICCRSCNVIKDSRSTWNLVAWAGRVIFATVLAFLCCAILPAPRVEVLRTEGGAT